MNDPKLMVDYEILVLQYSEGNNALYNLLLYCFEHDIKTIACCKGHEEEGKKPYIAFKFNDLNSQYYDAFVKYLLHYGYIISYHKNAQNNSWFSIMTTQYSDPDASLLFEKILGTIKLAEINKDKQSFSQIINQIDSYGESSITFPPGIFQINFLKTMNGYEYMIHNIYGEYAQNMKDLGFEKIYNRSSSFFVSGKRRENVSTKVELLYKQICR